MGNSYARSPLYAPLPDDIGWQKFGNRLYVEPDLFGDECSKVYRYCTLAEAFMLVRSGCWSLSRPTAWPDIYEKHVAKELFAEQAAFAAMPGFVKCVSFEYSSEAMWRTYSTSGGLVRLSWRLRDLLLQLDAADWGVEGKIYVGRVRYMDARDIRQEVSDFKEVLDEEKKSRHAMRALMMKRAGFAFENELRICLFPSTPPKESFITVRGFSAADIRGVLIDPYLSPWQANEIEQVFKSALHLECMVEQSCFDTVFHPKAG